MYRVLGAEDEGRYKDMAGKDMEEKNGVNNPELEAGELCSLLFAVLIDWKWRGWNEQ